MNERIRKHLRGIDLGGLDRREQTRKESREGKKTREAEYIDPVVAYWKLKNRSPWSV